MLVKLARIAHFGAYFKAFYAECNANGNYVGESSLIISRRDAMRLAAQHDVEIDWTLAVEQERRCTVWTDPLCYPQLNPNNDVCRWITGSSFANEVRHHITFCLEDDIGRNPEDPSQYNVY